MGESFHLSFPGVFVLPEIDEFMYILDPSYSLLRERSDLLRRRRQWRNGIPTADATARRRGARGFPVARLVEEAEISALQLHKAQMLLSCCSQSCKCGNLCVNKPFQYQPVKKMKLIETEKCGSGVVTEEDIRQGDFVIEYVGEVIDDKTCEERLWKMKHCGETNFYLCEINRDMVIDATYKGNKSRFINHSCQPNTEMQKWTIDGEIRIGIFATRDIKKGEELTYDYQFVQFGADQDCYCGSVGCRKKLGNKPSKLKFSSSDTALQLVLCEIAASSPNSKALLYGKANLESGRSNMEGSQSFVARKRKSEFHNCIYEVVRIWSPQYKRYYGGVILEFDCYSRKHTIITEDERVENVDLSKEDWDFL
ncbi:hypothetical protein C4D60_Mb02t13150 [Musa balbisiana]|uniref:Histone-lysine N-methyltransferase n=1 Tax=Musa balbisiana TaxID=52838 RepID=A0A4S8IAC4_MUSBA|nr:hypothetical protein C4D60_Mb02t13150 [Musa balbisiana]